MKSLNKILKYFLYALLIPILYLLIALILSSITIDRKINDAPSHTSIYLSTNGVHLDIIIPKQHIDPKLLNGLKHNGTDQYMAFGWGDENFYLNTPTWNDLTFNNGTLSRKKI